MRVQKRSPWLSGLGMVLTAIALWGAQAQAEVSSDRPGSVVMYPKVIADGTRDTIITLTNTRNEPAYAHCEYVQAIGICAITGDLCDPDAEVPGSPGICPPVTGNICNAQWQSSDFEIMLTRQQPTFWRVSTGRYGDPFLLTDGVCLTTPGVPPLQACPGIFPNQILPVVDQPFRGELRCFQINNIGGDLLAANGLKGEAVIETLPGELAVSTQISKYNSINIPAFEILGDDSIIRLNDIEYGSCPEAVEVTHYSPNADVISFPDDFTACDGPGCPVNTEITLVPCRADFENEEGTRFATDIRYTDEFEQELSVEHVFDCWANFDLRDLPFANVNSSSFQRTRVVPTGSGICIAGAEDTPCDEDSDCGAGGVCGPVSGVLAIVEEFYDSAASLADPPTVHPGTAAANGYSVDFNDDGDLGRPGHCRGAIRTQCEDNADCPPGFCRIATTTACTSDTQCPGVGDFCDQCMNDEITTLIGQQ